MYSITAEIIFHAGHYVIMPDGLVEESHFHDWKLQATVTRPDLDKDGFVMDFHQLQHLMQQSVGPLEKQENINDLDAFIETYPTTERIAKYLYDQLKAKLPVNVALSQISLWETPGCLAVYQPQQLE